MESGQYQRSTGGRLPDWFVNRPLSRPGDLLWLRAYRRLNTHRQISREFACPIPWDVIAEYGDRLGFVGAWHDVFVDTMMVIDQKHREWHREQNDRESKREARRQRRAAASAGVGPRAHES